MVQSATFWKVLYFESMEGPFPLTINVHCAVGYFQKMLNKLEYEGI